MAKTKRHAHHAHAAKRRPKKPRAKRTAKPAVHRHPAAAAPAVHHHVKAATPVPHVRHLKPSAQIRRITKPTHPQGHLERLLRRATTKPVSTSRGIETREIRHVTHGRPLL